MYSKRITLLCGHYGSGKTNVAVNIAFDLKKQHEKVTVADLDIVNPYFRSKDSIDDFNNAGIRLICSEFANSNVDIPALPEDLYAITDDTSHKVVIDVGGDDRGALALGRIAPKILEEDNFDMFIVINCFRPLTRDVKSTVEVIKEIEAATSIPFTGIINNSNLGKDTTANDILNSLEYAREVAKALGIPLVATSVKEDLIDDLKAEVDNLLPLKLQNNTY